MILALIPFYLYKRKYSPANKIYWLFVFTLAYSLFRVIISDGDIEKSFLIIPIVLSFFTILIPFSFSKLITNNLTDIKKNIYMVATIIAFCTAVYSIRHLLGGSSGVRLTSPLGGAAVNHVGLLLILSVYLSSFKIGYKKTLSLFLAIITIGMIFLAGSRTGFITMLALILLMLIDFKKPVRSIFLFISFAVTFILFFQFSPTSERYSNLHSSGREITLETSLDTVSESVSNFILGTGTGSIWPWYAYESGHMPYNALDNMVYTNHGYTLTNPHSLYLGNFVELGLIGILPIIIISLIIIKAFFNSMKSGNQFITYILIGVALSLVSFALDYYLYKNFPVSTIWWYFVFYSVSATYLYSNKEKQERL